MDKRSSIRVPIVALSADYLAPDLDLGSTFIFICFHAFMMWLLMTDITSLHHYSASPLPNLLFHQHNLVTRQSEKIFICNKKYFLVAGKFTISQSPQLIIKILSIQRYLNLNVRSMFWSNDSFETWNKNGFLRKY